MNKTVKIKKYLVFFLFVIITYVLGYIREAVFITINSVINEVPFPYNRAYITPPPFLYKLSMNQLFILKWVLTLLFFLLFLLVAVKVTHFFFRNKKYNKIVMVFFVTFFSLSLVFYIIGFLFDNLSFFYPISRFFAGLVQDPFPIYLFLVLFFYTNNVYKA